MRKTASFLVVLLSVLNGVQAQSGPHPSGHEPGLGQRQGPIGSTKAGYTVTGTFFLDCSQVDLFNPSGVPAPPQGCMTDRCFPQCWQQELLH